MREGDGKGRGQIKRIKLHPSLTYYFHVVLRNLTFSPSSPPHSFAHLVPLKAVSVFSSRTIQMVIVILISLLSTSFLLVFGCGKKQAKPVPPTSVQANPSSISKVGSNPGNSPKQAAPAEVKDEKGKPPDNDKKEVEKTQDSEKRKASKELAECTGRDKSKKGVSSKKVDKKKSKEASKMAGKDGDGKAMPGSAEMSAASAAVPPAGGGAADDGGYEDCPDLTPEELAKIAAGGK